MNGMLDEALAFNVDLSRWDVSSVTRMSQAFQFAHAFNQVSAASAPLEHNGCESPDVSVKVRTRAHRRT